MRKQRRIRYLFLLGFMVMCGFFFMSTDVTDHLAGYSFKNRIKEEDDVSVPTSTFHSTLKFDSDKGRLKYPWKDLPTCDQYTVQVSLLFVTQSQYIFKIYLFIVGRKRQPSEMALDFFSWKWCHLDEATN